jgi:prepilin-type N-terminal cleavage/methylation domain-containing protein
MRLSERQRLPGSNGRSTGFTLIEVIVAMLIASMIVTVVFSGLGVAFDAWASTTRRIDDLETNRYAWRALRRQLESALPLATVVEDGLTRTPIVGFEGEPGSIRFVSHSSFGMGPTAPARWVEWEIEDNGIRIREYDIVPPDNRPADEPAWEGFLAVAEESRGLEFGFLRGRTTFDPPNFTGEWIDDWDPAGRGTIPDAVRIHTPGNVAPAERFWMLVALDYADSAGQGMRLE